MITETTFAARVKRLRERYSRGAAMVEPVEVGEGGVKLLISNGLLKEYEGEACLAALEQWSMGRGARSTGR